MTPAHKDILRTVWSNPAVREAIESLLDEQVEQQKLVMRSSVRDGKWRAAVLCEGRLQAVQEIYQALDRLETSR